MLLAVVEWVGEQRFSLTELPIEIDAAVEDEADEEELTVEAC